MPYQKRKHRITKKKFMFFIGCLLFLVDQKCWTVFILGLWTGICGPFSAWVNYLWWIFSASVFWSSGFCALWEIKVWFLWTDICRNTLCLGSLCVVCFCLRWLNCWYFALFMGIKTIQWNCHNGMSLMNKLPWLS